MQNYDDQPERKSRSQRKRDSTALQKIGVELASLGRETLRKAPLSQDIKEALLEFKAMTKHEARRRQMQLIGKLMREADIDPIEEFLDRFRAGKSKTDRAFQQIEEWRDRLMDGDDGLMEELMERFPGGDRQQLRQLTLSARRERAKEQPPKHFRALFRFLRDLTANS
ncbi:MAG: DUF615 domain-containing protein [Proteobacteria bacterium]|nr:DUF615 domain-containing protein [Pseudomonadota bacterium]MBU1610342.1 DUF615 domain-containing protein [Pseudomonadota bacterium]